MFIKYEGSHQLSHKVSDILFKYRNLPHSTTGKTPAKLFLKRSPRTVLSLIKPCLQKRVELSQAATKFQRDGNHPKHRFFDKFQRVRVRNVRGGKEKWIPGVIVNVKGPHTYLVRVPGNNCRFVHADHLVPDGGTGTRTQVLDSESFVCVEIESKTSPQRSCIPRDFSDEHVQSTADTDMSPVLGTPSSPSNSSKSVIVSSPKSGTPLLESEPGANSPIINPGDVKTSRSGRVIRPPRKLNLYVN